MIGGADDLAEALTTLTTLTASSAGVLAPSTPVDPSAIRRTRRSIVGDLTTLHRSHAPSAANAGAPSPPADAARRRRGVERRRRRPRLCRPEPLEPRFQAMDGRSAGPLSGSTASPGARRTLSFKSAQKRIALVNGDAARSRACPIERSPAVPPARRPHLYSTRSASRRGKRRGVGRAADAPTNPSNRRKSHPNGHVAAALALQSVKPAHRMYDKGADPCGNLGKTWETSPNFSSSKVLALRVASRTPNNAIYY